MMCSSKKNGENDENWTNAIPYEPELQKRLILSRIGFETPVEEQTIEGTL
jgi:hypothetical protein